MANIDVKSITLDSPYEIKMMGTSGLRMTQEDYNRPGFLEQFCEGIARYFKDLTDNNNVAPNNTRILIGGDPRKGNGERLRTCASILVAHGFTVFAAKDNLASTPAMSHAIRHLEAAGGIVLTASHNPFTDVGVKINMSDGSPALEDTTVPVHEQQNRVRDYSIVDFDEALQVGLIQEFDPVALYADLLDSILDFQSMKEKLKTTNIKAAFDAMHGAAGPFAREVFINRLGLDAMILREEPREDLGGFDANGEPMHPEPDFDYIDELIRLNSSGEYQLVSAWDSDVDRRLDGGSGFFIESADEFAVFARYSDLINVTSLFEKDIIFCRSTVTAHTIDVMVNDLEKKFNERNVRAVETPTGFKWIAELGNWGVEESNGVGNPYHREKDGIFSTAFLLKIMLETGKSPIELMEEVWEDYGRIYFTRGEVSGSDNSEKDQLEAILKEAPRHQGTVYGDLTLEKASAWDYQHPLTGEIASRNAAYVLDFSEGNKVKARFSGTGSGGYTLRVYCSKFDEDYRVPKSGITQPMKYAFDEFLRANGFSSRSEKFTDAHQPDPYHAGDASSDA